MENKKEKIITWTKMFKSLWFFIDEEKLKFSFYMFLNFISHSNNLIIPFMVGLIINFFTTYSVGDNLKLFYIYTFIILLSSLITSQIRMIAKRKLNEISVNTKFKVRTKGFNKLLNFSLKWHENENTGNKTQKITKGSDSYRQLIQLFNMDILQILLNLGGILVIFTFLDFYFLIFFLIYILIYIFIIKYFFNKQFILEEEKNKEQEKVSGSLIESTSNILSIKSSGSSKNIETQMFEKESILKEHQFKIIKNNNNKTKIINVLTSFGIFFFLLLIGYYVSNDLIKVGFIATAFAYFNTITSQFWRSNKIINDLISSRSSINRLMPIFETKEDKYFGEKDFNNYFNNISFENVDFSYDNKINNLNNISFEIKRNEKIGIVGHSGSGKSTLSKLLLGLYKINSGLIKIDKENFYNFSHSKLLENLAPVMQETEMFNLSLKENITMLKDCDIDLLEKAIDISNLLDLIKKLPNGINTIIGEKGYKLSGGERQRVGIARAIYKNSPILILDEATSALDSKTEMKIQKGIDQLENKTILIIAHRLSTLKNVDSILVFDKGKIIEGGNFKDLIKDKKSKFYKLWNMQNKK